MDSFYDLSHRSYDIFKNNEILKDLATATGGSIVSLFGNEQKTEQHRVLVPELDVAGVKFKGLVTITTADNISRIGIDMLKHGITTIDFKNKRFYFDADGETVDVSKPLPGFTPTVENGRLVVGYVWDKKLKSKLSYGDEIIKIQDTDISKMKFCDFLKQKHIFEEADTLSIVFKTKTGDISNITIIKETPEL
jgi:hypothetical protein